MTSQDAYQKMRSNSFSGIGVLAITIEVSQRLNKSIRVRSGKSGVVSARLFRDVTELVK
jgi:hypothetical protein